MAPYASMKKADLLAELIARDAQVREMNAARQRALWDAAGHDTRDSLAASYAALQVALDQANARCEAAESERKAAEANAATYATEAAEAAEALDAHSTLARAAEHVSLDAIGGARVVDVDASGWYHRITIELDDAGHGHMLQPGDALTLTASTISDLSSLGSLI